MAKIYLATALTYKREAQHWMNQARAAGIEITHDWTIGEDTSDPHDELECMKHATDDLRGVFDCDLFWLLVPEVGGAGCWVEFGYALALERPTIVSGPAKRSIFTARASRIFAYHHEAMSWVRTFCGEWREVLSDAS